MTESTQFKHKISAQTIAALAPRFAELLPGFDADAFRTHALDGLETLALKARLKQVARAARGAWSGPLTELIEALPEIAAQSPALTGFAAWPLLQVIEDHGLPARDASLAAMRALTARWSAEFAIRPFLRADPVGTLAVLQRWATDPDAHLRRLVSEGSRPRLPWGGRLARFDADPNHTLPLLEQLRSDPSLYVRRSVANHLGDLAKTHPDRVVAVLSRWQREVPGPETTWLVRHAARSLIKQGHRGALTLRGFEPPAIVVDAFAANPAVLRFGGQLQLHATLRSTAPNAQRWAVDFVVHHVKAKGDRAPKVFKWREVRAAPGAVVQLKKNHAIRPITTRRYYPGLHRVELQVNGVVLAGADFTLVM